MCDTSLDFWRDTLQLPVTRFDAALIKQGFHPNQVYRVTVEYELQADGPRSLIYKCAYGPWADDSFGQAREYRVYQECLSQIPIAKPPFFLPAISPDGTHRIVLQDLSGDHNIFPPEHVWSWVEARAMLRTYAKLHAFAPTLNVPQRPYLMPPLARRWTPDQIRSMIADFLSTPWLAPRVEPAARSLDLVLNEVAALEPLAALEPQALVHYDAYPPNVAFASDGDADAILIDWELATCDIAEIDLAALFLQPYHSDRVLDWHSVLEYYWQLRSQLDGKKYDLAARVPLFRYARLQTLLNTIVPIHHAWQKAVSQQMPFAPDAPDPYARYFDAMSATVMTGLSEKQLSP